MNRIGIIVVCLALLGAALLYIRQGTKDSQKAPLASSVSQVDAFKTWQEFKPQSGLFKVSLPHRPQYAKDLVPIPGTSQNRRYDMYASEDIDGTLYLISVITYPAESETPEEGEDILKQIVDELMKTKPGNQLSMLKDNPFKNQHALDFSFVNRDFYVEGKIFMIGKTVYVLNYVTRKENLHQEDFQHFLDSFELTGGNPPAVPAAKPEKPEVQQAQ